MSIDPGALQIAVRAALQGPEQRDVRFGEYRFNIKPAHMNRWQGDITIVGDRDDYISRRRRGRANDRIYYRIEIKGDTIDRIGVFMRRGGPLATVTRGMASSFRRLSPVSIPRVIGPWSRDHSSTVNEEALDATRALLDGTWKGEARFLVAHIALAAH